METKQIRDALRKQTCVAHAELVKLAREVDDAISRLRTAQDRLDHGIEAGRLPCPSALECAPRTQRALARTDALMMLLFDAEQEGKAAE